MRFRSVEISSLSQLRVSSFKSQGLSKGRFAREVAHDNVGVSQKGESLILGTPKKQPGILLGRLNRSRSKLGFCPSCSRTTLPRCPGPGSMRRAWTAFQLSPHTKPLVPLGLVPNLTRKGGIVPEMAGFQAWELSMFTQLLPIGGRFPLMLHRQVASDAIREFCSLWSKPLPTRAGWTATLMMWVF